MDFSNGVNDSYSAEVHSVFDKALRGEDVKDLSEVNKGLFEFVMERGSFESVKEAICDADKSISDGFSESEDQGNDLQTSRSSLSNADAGDFSEDKNKSEDSDTIPSSQQQEKESFSYKQEMDELMSNFSSKIDETKNLISVNCELQKKYEQLQAEKNEWINQISVEFAAQKKSQLLQESTIEEIKQLKLQVQHLEGENSCLKTETKDLALKTSELQTKFEQLQNESNEWMRGMTAEFAAQKNSQLSIESSVNEEIDQLKIQVKDVEKETSLIKVNFLRYLLNSLLVLIPFSWVFTKK